VEESNDPKVSIVCVEGSRDISAEVGSEDDFVEIFAEVIREARVENVPSFVEDRDSFGRTGSEIFWDGGDDGVFKVAASGMVLAIGI
jgi:hypothetical protein